jgi:integrase
MVREVLIAALGQRPMDGAPSDSLESWSLFMETKFSQSLLKLRSGISATRSRTKNALPHDVPLSDAAL